MPTVKNIKTLRIRNTAINKTFFDEKVMQTLSVDFFQSLFLKRARVL
jgi:hypothetical protein